MKWSFYFSLSFSFIFYFFLHITFFFALPCKFLSPPPSIFGARDGFYFFFIHFTFFFPLVIGCRSAAAAGEGMGTGKELRCAIMKREREKEKKGICGGMKAGIGAFFFPQSHMYVYALHTSMCLLLYPCT